MWISIIHKPFPLSSWKNFWRRGLGFGLFVFLFLYLFKPFRLDLYGERLLFATSMYGLVTMGVYLLGGFILVRIIGPRIKEEKWTLGKQVLWMTGLLVCIALLNTYVTQLMLGQVFPLQAYILMLKWVVMLGIFPIAFAELMAYNRSLRQHLASASQLTHLIETQPPHDTGQKTKAAILGSIKEVQDPPPLAEDKPVEWLCLQGENQHENLQLAAENLLAVQSVDNYVTVYWIQEGQLQQQLLRNTLTNIALQVRPTPWLFRTHRAWLVNTKQVTRVDGNAQGYRLSLPLLPFQVPVSRSNIENFKQLVSR